MQNGGTNHVDNLWALCPNCHREKGLMNKIQLLGLDNITLIQGNFSETIESFFNENSKKVFSANIDCDLYEGYKITLTPLFNNLVNGGYIHLDEYYSLKYPGPKIAVDEFLSKNPKLNMRKLLLKF